jgi:hypothetical protein
LKLNDHRSGELKLSKCQQTMPILANVAVTRRGDELGPAEVEFLKG